MVENVGSTDRKLRTAIGALAGFGSLGILGGIVSLPTLVAPVLGVIALAMLVTAASGSCGLYSLLGVSTCSRNADAPQ